MTWILEIPIPTPSLNEIQGKHWAVVHSRKQDMKAALAVAILHHLKRIPKATGKRRLIITRHGIRLLDPDNLSGGCKGLIDALKHRGLILNDDPASIEVTFRQVITKEKPHTVVVIEEAA